MNSLEMASLEAFRRIGWKIHQDKTGDVVLLKSDDDEELQAILQIRQLPTEQKMTLIASTGLKKYSNIVGLVLGEKTSHEWLHQKDLVRSAIKISDKEIEEVSKEAIEWWRGENNLEAIKALADILPSTGQPQLKHLAALAYLGDFNTLMNYQKIFRAGKRLNFVPMIKPEMIDRAVAIALERA